MQHDLQHAAVNCRKIERERGERAVVSPESPPSTDKHVCATAGTVARGQRSSSPRTKRKKQPPRQPRYAKACSKHDKSSRQAGNSSALNPCTTNFLFSSRAHFECKMSGFRERANGQPPVLFSVCLSVCPCTTKLSLVLQLAAKQSRHTRLPLRGAGRLHGDRHTPMRAVILLFLWMDGRPDMSCIRGTERHRGLVTDYC